MADKSCRNKRRVSGGYSLSSHAQTTISSPSAISLQSNYSGLLNNLYFRFEEKGFTGKLNEGHQPYQGDDWEFFFAGKDKKQYLQFMIAPSGKYAVLWKKGSTEWLPCAAQK